MPRTNYIFIDYENVHETDLSRIKDRSAVVHLVLGAKQPSPSEQLHRQMEKLAEKAELIRTPIAAKNSLDFVLTCEVGMRAARDPRGYFHIISRDKGYDVVVKHLKELGIFAARRESLSEVPALMTTEERLELLLKHLEKPGTPRPCKRRTLASTIQSFFDRALTDEVVEKTIGYLVHKDILRISEYGKVTYMAA